MPDLFLMPFAFCRIPALAADADADSSRYELELLIADASPELFKLLRGNADTTGPKSAQIRHSLANYFNRARSRPTPFGKFASVSILPVVDGIASDSPIIAAAPEYLEYADWQLTRAILKNPAWHYHNADLFQANATAWQFGDEIKYLFFNGASYELSSVSSAGWPLAGLLQFTGSGKSRAELENYLLKKANIAQRKAASLLKQLLGLQLLISDRDPNIIGEDFFQRTRTITTVNKSYVLSKRSIDKGHLSNKQMAEICDAVTFLNRYLPHQDPPDLRSFKEKFAERYDTARVSLSTVLDPETGIGYARLERSPDHAELAERLAESPAGNTAINDNWLRRAIVNAAISGTVLQLADIKPPVAVGDPPMLPNSFSALIQLQGDQIIAERIGGATANALAGRFSLLGDDYTECCRKIASHEQSANPGVVFFDVGYRAELNVDNVNRRRDIYEIEFPIGCYSLSKRIISLSDISVSLEHGELILYSYRLQKRIMPRIASAYNYTRSDLPLFRFFADVQHQGLRASLSIDPIQLAGGLDRYPRVQFKKIILACAKWRVPERFISGGTEPSPQTIDELSNWLEGLNIRHFKFGKGDQKLLFDAWCRDDLRLFLQNCHGDPPLYVDEALISQQYLVTDRSGRPYHHELLISICHSQTLYKAAANRPDPPGRAIYLPGSEWVYFELYMHPQSADLLLRDFIGPFMAAHKHHITTWFFIRYNSPADHIRFRFRLKEPGEGWNLIQNFTALIAKPVSDGVISNVLLKPYVPELMRYGAHNMAVTEKFFQADSAYVISVLNNNCDTITLYHAGIDYVRLLLSTLGLDSQEQLQIVSLTAKAFACEQHYDIPKYKTINRFCRTHTCVFQKVPELRKVSTLKAKAAKSFARVILRTEALRQPGIISDMVHMHINRLFPENQRVHESIIYHYLEFELKARIARERPDKTIKEK